MTAARRPQSASSDLTRLELCALTDFLSAALNDPDTLGSSGLTTQEKNAVSRAHDKLVGWTADRTRGTT